jgi:aspartate--ammonia ligase
MWLRGEVKTPPLSSEARVEAGLLLRRLQRGERLEVRDARSLIQQTGRAARRGRARVHVAPDHAQLAMPRQRLNRPAVLRARPLDTAASRRHDPFMPNAILPKGYRSVLDVKQTETAIKQIKDFFQLNLSTELRLRRVTAPLFLEKGTGVNDDLNGVERPVCFHVKDMASDAEIVQSLAKWKRLALADYGIEPGFGLYTDMNAIRPDEGLDNIHSLYVDQWDWERVITARDRTLAFLQHVVDRIYGVIARTEYWISELYAGLEPCLPDRITFVHAEELRQRWPRLTPREREDEICREAGAVFVSGIGHPLSDGTPHDGRAPDYDDWSTPNEAGYHGLNGDIIVWNPVLERSFELSSMGIRVDPEALGRQLAIRGCEDRRRLPFHRRLLAGELPLSIGGGIGQSRLCMLYLRKAHIGEIQVSLWPPDTVRSCHEAGIFLL